MLKKACISITLQEAYAIVTGISFDEVAKIVHAVEVE
jgi:hypothetical protein